MFVPGLVKRRNIERRVISLKKWIHSGVFFILLLAGVSIFPMTNIGRVSFSFFNLLISNVNLT
jgi:hypothetical protein